MAKNKERLDKLLVTRGLVATRSKAQGIILAGEVLVDGARVDKPGTAVSTAAAIELKAALPYVGRGGFKLAGALTTFGLVVAGAVCADEDNSTHSMKFTLTSKLAGLVTAQAVLGVVTLLQQAPIALALAHQMLAILVLTVAVLHAERLSHRSASTVQIAEQGA